MIFKPKQKAWVEAAVAAGFPAGSVVGYTEIDAVCATMGGVTRPWWIINNPDFRAGRGKFMIPVEGAAALHPAKRDDPDDEQQHEEGPCEQFIGHPCEQLGCDHAPPSPPSLLNSRLAALITAVALSRMAFVMHLDGVRHARGTLARRLASQYTQANAAKHE